MAAATSAEKPKYKGGCFCGKVKFELHGNPAFVVNCHCSVCRRCHSADYAPLVGYAPADIKITEGEANLAKWTTGREDRFSCKDCGAKVYSELNHLKHRAVFTNNIDGHGADGRIGEQFRPTAHIFYGSGVVSVYDGLPKYNTMPKAFGGDDVQLPEEYHDTRDAFVSSCPCGSLKVRFSSEPMITSYCHCKSCAKIHGAPFVDYAIFPVPSVKYVKGKELDLNYKMTEGTIRHACSKCGGRMACEPLGYGIMGFPLESFSNRDKLPASFKPTSHLNVESATVYVDDGLPHYKTRPKSIGGDDVLVPPPKKN